MDVSSSSRAQAVKMTNVRWKIFLLLLMLVSINYIDRAALSVAMPAISQEFSLTPERQGIILSSFSGPICSCRSRRACWRTA